MAINRYELISRHNPVLNSIDYRSAMSIGNGEFAFTADITGLQTLYEEYNDNMVPLCTMSQWGWHTTPAYGNRYAYTFDDLVMTEYKYVDRTVTYAVECKPGNEDVYYWLRKNPHRFNLGRLGFLYKGKKIKQEDITDIKQTLYLYEGILESTFKLFGTVCRVRTCCHYETDTIAVEAESELFREGSLTVALLFPYGSPEINASDWNSGKLHESRIILEENGTVCIERKMDKTQYYAWIRLEGNALLKRAGDHDFRIEAESDKLAFTL
ncbi:MAG TPA: glycoside hydrolase family 65, partial [Mobilitalea sp.]|nr:glycoside hydrolase family 65 [Mobilitalea sp.]